MAFTKGKPKTGGRQKGVPNKDKASVRSIVEGILGRSIPEELLAIAKARPQEKKEILLALLPYTYPKLASTEVTASLTGEIDVRAHVEMALKDFEEMEKD